MRQLLVFFLILINVCVSQAQTARNTHQKPITFSVDFAGMEDSIAQLSGIVINDSVYAHRLEANEKLLPLMRRFLAAPQSFNYNFTKLESISVLQPEDKSFRVISWAFYASDTESKHFGFIQLNKSKSSFVELHDSRTGLKVDEAPLTETLSSDNWLGALYYNIKPFKTKNGTKYLLFGLNLGSGAEKTKLCDVLNVKNNRVSFGAPVFENTNKRSDKKNYRIAVTYSGDSGLRLNYDEDMKQIVFDHVEAVGTGNGDITYVPDGTYEAYQFKKGVWLYIEKLANTEMSEAPRPKPVLGQRIKIKDANSGVAKGFQFPKE